MIILAVDTSSEVASVAVTSDGHLLGEIKTRQKKEHSKNLLPQVSNLLDSIKLTSAKIDLFAVCTGPGSFTGLRIGITMIKTMAWLHKKPVAAVTAPDAMARQCMPLPSGFFVCPVIDAKNGQLFTALYMVNADSTDVNADNIDEISDSIEVISDSTHISIVNNDNNIVGTKLLRLTDYLAISVEELSLLIKYHMEAQHQENPQIIFIGDGVIACWPVMKEAFSNGVFQKVDREDGWDSPGSSGGNGLGFEFDSDPGLGFGFGLGFGPGEVYVDKTTLAFQIAMLAEESWQGWKREQKVIGWQSVKSGQEGLKEQNGQVVEIGQKEQKEHNKQIEQIRQIRQIGDSTQIFDDPKELLPFYLRKPQAERMMEKEHNINNVKDNEINKAIIKSGSIKNDNIKNDNNKKDRQPGIKIVKADARFIDDLIEVENSCFTIPWSKESILNDITSSQNPTHYLCAIINGKAIGYTGLWKIFDEGHITNIAVHPKYQRKGIGGLLLSRLLKSSSEEEGITKFTLEVRKSNIAAIKLYEKFGFCEGGVRKEYYSDNGEDAIIMWKEK